MSQPPARFRLVAVILFLAGLGLTYVVLHQSPLVLVPNEDQGYFIIMVQSPSGAFCNTRKRFSFQVEKIVRPISEIEGAFPLPDSGFAETPIAALFLSP